MNVGTRSVLVGVHAFWWHPLVVFAAFCRVHKCLPSWWQTVAIVTHDISYWGCADMDGPEGINHPRGGAAIAARICGLFSPERAFDAYFFSLYHSSNFARLHGATPSDLYLPDKVSILMEPKWWYLFRARLSGELTEYVERESEKLGLSSLTPNVWYDMYKKLVQDKLRQHEKNSAHSGL